MLTPQRIDELTDNARRSLARLDATLAYSNALTAPRIARMSDADIEAYIEANADAGVVARLAADGVDVTGSPPQRIAEAMAKGEAEDAERMEWDRLNEGDRFE
jgi:hypothetical protein